MSLTKFKQASLKDKQELKDEVSDPRIAELADEVKPKKDKKPSKKKK